MRRFLFLVFFLLLGTLVTAAQEEPQARLLLRADSTEMQTGETYEVHIEVRNVADFWSADMVIQYDPQQIYILGTRAGSPVALGEWMQPGGTIIRNSVSLERRTLTYTPSLLAPAEPLSGGGVIGTFQIVPLVAGQAQLLFIDAELASITYATNAEGQRVVESSSSIPFLPVLLELSVTGEPATPPAEATATPAPTATPLPIFEEEETPQAEPTALLNVTLAPETPIAPTPIPVDAPQEDGNNTLLLAGIVLILFALIGLAVLFTAFRRSQK